MSHARKRRCCMLEEDSEAGSDAQPLTHARVAVPVQGEESSPPSSSLPSSICSSSISSSNSAASSTSSTSFPSSICSSSFSSSTSASSSSTSSSSFPSSISSSNSAASSTSSTSFPSSICSSSFSSSTSASSSSTSSSSFPSSISSSTSSSSSSTPASSFSSSICSSLFPSTFSSSTFSPSSSFSSSPSSSSTSSSSSSTSSSTSSSSSSTSSSSFSSSSPRSASPPLSSSPEEDFTSARSPAFSRGTQGDSSPLTGSLRQSQEGPSSAHMLPDPEVLSSSERDEKVTNLVNLLLLKYQIKEPVTEAEILSIIQTYNHFSMIFTDASDCLRLVFGIYLKDTEPPGRSYNLVTSLGISYDGMLSEVQGLPKTGLLVLILSIIVLQGDCAPEEDIWRALSAMGIRAGKKHFIYGEPRKLILGDFVQEQYLAYRQVRGSKPARYELLWGPKTHAETSEVKIREFLASVTGNDPKSFRQRYAEALRDEEGRSQGRTLTAGPLPGASSSVASSVSGAK